MDQAIPPVNPNPRPSPVSGVPPPVAHQFRPGESGNPHGRPRGASAIAPFLRDMAKGAVIGDDGEVIKYGDRSEEIAQVLYELCVGKRDPASVDIKALGIAIDRTDGPLVKERINTNTHVVQGITLEDRRKDAPPVPGTESK